MPAPSLQRGTSAYEPRLPHAERVRGPGKQTQRPRRQRAGPLPYVLAFAPRPVLNRPARGKRSKQGTSSQANRGPKKTGQVRAVAVTKLIIKGDATTGRLA